MYRRTKSQFRQFTKALYVFRPVILKACLPIPFCAVAQDTRRHLLVTPSSLLYPSPHPRVGR
jgi:hypothetical protein